MKKIIYSTIATLFAMSASAAEVDNFKAHRLNLPDETIRLNAMANSYMAKALSKANAKSHCNEEDLYSELQEYFANHQKGIFTKNVLSGEKVEIHRYKVKHSIYKDWDFSDGFALASKILGRMNLVISPLVNVNNVNIGVDKFEHMFGMGFNYYERFYQEGKSIQEVLEYGTRMEKFILGGISVETGIFSYGDLSANFNGMRFWNHMLQKKDDVLGSQYNAGPYVRCENKKWVAALENPIDFSHYIDASMDESVNCSQFPFKKTANKFINAVRNSGYKGVICSQTSAEMVALKEKYHPHGIKKSILNYLGPVKY